jgi:hypothetical protein
LLRPNEEYLSTNWLEYFHDSDRQSQIVGVHQALTDKGFRVSPTGSFAVLNVGNTVSTVRQARDLKIRFVNFGEPHDPSHTGIFGYNAEDTDTATALARLAREVHPTA